MAFFANASNATVFPRVVNAMMQSYVPQALKAAIFDWSGTIVDHGSRAPVAVFIEVFRRRAVAISEQEARLPMGREKKDHIRAIAAQPALRERWQALHGRMWDESDIEAMYQDSRELQAAIVESFADPVPGALGAIAACRAQGLQVGSTTGYSRLVMDRLAPAAAARGYQPDCIVCADEVPEGRPAPYMLWQALSQLQVYPAAAAVAIGDTVPDIGAGRNAGCWTIGLSESGNGMGLTAEGLATLEPGERSERRRAISRQLEQAGAHYVIASVAELASVLASITARLERGEAP